jgi:hypothetical protein
LTAKERRSASSRIEDLPMHSFLVATLFVAMVLAPCIAAMLTGIDRPDETPQPHTTEAP